LKGKREGDEEVEKWRLKGPRSSKGGEEGSTVHLSVSPGIIEVVS